jgi:hypothetical protein
MNPAKFQLGLWVSTPAALEALQAADEPAIEYIRRHSSGDWGDVPADDAASNDAAVKDGERIQSVYHLSTGVEIWIITEADRSVTTILLPEDY